MKKYRSPWGMSTRNHNILCFHYIPGTLLLNRAIFLWKVKNSHAERGVRPSEIDPNPVQIAGAATSSLPFKSLAPTATRNKAQKRCRNRPILCELWTTAHYLLDEIWAPYASCSPPTSTVSSQPARPSHLAAQNGTKSGLRRNSFAGRNLISDIKRPAKVLKCSLCRPLLLQNH